MVSKLDLKGSDWIVAPRAYYRFSDLKGSKSIHKPRAYYQDFTVEMSFKTLYQKRGLQNGP